VADISADEIDPAECAAKAGLTYVSDEEPGLHRKKWGRGYTVLDPEGEHMQDDSVHDRIAALAIPPAWTEVWICMDPMGHLQVTGRDDRGRKQYIYHPEWERARTAMKFSRVAAFGESLPALRKHCKKELERSELSREKVLSAVVFLLDKTLVRIGNEAYAQHNDSFGLTTLRDSHVDFSGTRCTFEFPGKSGKEHHIELDDPRLARVVRACRDVPGQELFQYYDVQGCRQRIDSSDVNEFLKAVTGGPFTAKDFRTWGGSVAAATDLGTRDAPEGSAEVDKQIVEMVKNVADLLGNTPAICRDYYIHPRIIDAHREGTFQPLFREALKRIRSGYLDRREKALLYCFDQWENGGA